MEDRDDIIILAREMPSFKPRKLRRDSDPDRLIALITMVIECDATSLYDFLLSNSFPGFDMLLEAMLMVDCTEGRSHLVELKNRLGNYLDNKGFLVRDIDFLEDEPIEVNDDKYFQAYKATLEKGILEKTVELASSTAWIRNARNS